MSPSVEPVPLLDFIPKITPRFQAPKHLAPVAALFDRIAHGEEVFAYVDCPPRHGKTELLKHAVARQLLLDPSTQIGYGGYSAKFAQKKSREIRTLYRKWARLPKSATAVADWRTGVHEGGLWATGVDGSWTGEGFRLTIIDDPVKGRAAAESALEREKLWEWAVADLSTRREPGGSMIFVHTRWTTDDLGGRLIAQGILGRRVEHVHLPAIDKEGRALWPDRYPLAELERIRAGQGAYNWASLFMGQPFPRGGRVFNDVQLVDIVPAGLRVSLGVDLAASKKTHADYSVIVVLGIDDMTDKIYVLNVIRAQEPAPIFAQRIMAVQKEYPGVDARWYYAGMEKAVVDFEIDLGVALDARPASADKFIRAQPVAAAWNGTRPPLTDDAPAEERPGAKPPRIFVPREAEWADAFVSELVSFTGVADLHDDQVDAFAAAFDQIEMPGFVGAMKRWREVDVGYGPVEFAATGGWRR